MFYKKAKEKLEKEKGENLEMDENFALKEVVRQRLSENSYENIVVDDFIINVAVGDILELFSLALGDRPQQVEKNYLSNLWKDKTLEYKKGDWYGVPRKIWKKRRGDRERT